MTPVFAGKSKEGWKPVEIVDDQVGISGGFLLKPVSAPCLQIMTGETHMRFVEVNKNNDWFYKVVAGSKSQKGELGSVRVLDELRKQMETHLNTAVADSNEDDTAVADSNAVEDEDDPMDLLDDHFETPVKKAKSNAKPKAKPKAKGSTMTQSSIIEVIMPKSPPCAGVDNGNFTVTLYMMAGKKKCRAGIQKLFLRVDCISWLLAYAADEFFFQGVMRVDNEEPKEVNSTAVAGLNIEWDFTCDAWKAEFVSGEKCGTVRTLAMRDVSEKLWEKMVTSALPGAEGNFSEASIVKRKQVSKELMELWCCALVERQGTEFERKWGLRSTPRKQK